MRAKERWQNCIARILEEIADREPPRFPVDNLTDFEELFLDNGEEKSLTLEEFQASFGSLLGGQFTKKQWKRLFNDIDADRGGTVSWDEFTTFMIHQTMSAVSDYQRAKELVSVTSQPKTQHSHKESAPILTGSEKIGRYYSAGVDGIIKVWDNELQHVASISNFKFAASAEITSYISSIPICDLTVSGSILCAASVDKCINLYTSDTLHLVRRYIGRNTYNDITIPPLLLPHSSKPIDTVLLMGMTDTLSSVGLSQPTNGREQFCCGLMDGSILLYPTQRLAVAGEIQPSLVARNVHSGCVSKARFEESYNHILSVGWDKCICSTDAETGIVTTRFTGVEAEKLGVVAHSKGITDFAFHSPSKLLATVAPERDVCLWNPTMATPITKLTGHTALMQSITFNDQENQLISLSQDGMIKVWDLRTFRTFQTISFSSKMTAIHFDESTSRLIGLSGVPWGWCVRRTHCGFGSSYRSHIEPLVGFCFCEELDVLLTCDPFTSMSWKIKTGDRLLVWEGDTRNADVCSVCLDFSGRRLCSCTRDGKVFIYNHRSGQLMREERAEISDVIGCLYCCQLPNHVYLVLYSADRMVFLKELKDNEFEHLPLLLPGAHIVMATIGVRDSFGVPTIVCGTSTGAIITISATVRQVISTVFPVSQADVDPLQEFVGNRPIQRQVESLIVLPTKSLMLSVVGDRSLYFWSIGGKSKQIFVTSLEQCQQQLVSLVADSDETLLGVGDEFGVIHLFDIENLPVQTRRARYHTGQLQYLRSICVGHSSVTRMEVVLRLNLLIVLCSDQKISLWNVSTGERFGTLGEQLWTVRTNYSLTKRIRFPLEEDTRDVSTPPTSFLTAVAELDVVPTNSLRTQRSIRRANQMSRSASVDELRRHTLTPVLGVRKNSRIVKRGGSPSALTRVVETPDFPRGPVSPSRRCRYSSSIEAKKNEVPTLPPVVSLKRSYDTSHGNSREWARLTTPIDQCRMEQRSDTSRKIYDAKQKNPEGWSSTMVSSFMPVVEVALSSFDMPQAARKAPSFRKAK